MEGPQAAQLVRIVRGEVSWDSLREVGIKVERKGDQWNFPPTTLMVFPDVEDLAAGLINMSSNAVRLQDWALFVTVAASLISLERLDRTALGRELLDELWELSSGQPLNPQLLRKLRP